MKFKQIKDFPNYEISENGDVRNIETGRILKPSLKPCGNLGFCLRKNKIQYGFLAHRLVAVAFIENPLNLELVIHIDNDKTNNKVSNLKWVAFIDFMQNAHSKGIIDNKGTNNFHSKLDNDDVKTIKDLLAKKVSITEIAKLFNITHQMISCIKIGKSWKHIE